MSIVGCACHCSGTCLCAAVADLYWHVFVQKAQTQLLGNQAGFINVQRVMKNGVRAPAPGSEPFGEPITVHNHDDGNGLSIVLPDVACAHLSAFTRQAVIDKDEVPVSGIQQFGHLFRAVRQAGSESPNGKMLCKRFRPIAELANDDDSVFIHTPGALRGLARPAFLQGPIFKKSTKKERDTQTESLCLFSLHLEPNCGRNRF